MASSQSSLPPATLHPFYRILAGLKMLAVCKIVDSDNAHLESFLLHAIYLACCDFDGTLPPCASPLQPGEHEIRLLAVYPSVDNIRLMLSHLKAY